MLKTKQVYKSNRNLITIEKQLKHNYQNIKRKCCDMVLYNFFINILNNSIVDGANNYYNSNIVISMNNISEIL